MSDLVERLRDVASSNSTGGYSAIHLHEAAARIEALEAEIQSYAIRLSHHDVSIEKLEVALREIADLRYSNTSAAAIARAALAPACLAEAQRRQEQDT